MNYIDWLEWTFVHTHGADSIHERKKCMHYSYNGGDNGVSFAIQYNCEGK